MYIINIFKSTVLYFSNLVNWIISLSMIHDIVFLFPERLKKHSLVLLSFSLIFNPHPLFFKYCFLTFSFLVYNVVRL